MLVIDYLFGFLLFGQYVNFGGIPLPLTIPLISKEPID